MDILDARQRIAQNIMNAINTINITDNSVIVYDIDGTLFEENGTPIYPIIDTYRHAMSAGLKTAIITARLGTEQNITATQEQLHSHGIKDYTFMYFLHPTKNDPAWYKYIARKNLHERGHVVVISIGDMPWDIGHYGGIGFKVF